MTAKVSVVNGKKEATWLYRDKPTLGEVIQAAVNEFPGVPFECIIIRPGIISFSIGHESYLHHEDPAKKRIWFWVDRPTLADMIYTAWPKFKERGSDEIGFEGGYVSISIITQAKESGASKNEH